MMKKTAIALICSMVLVAGCGSAENPFTQDNNVEENTENIETIDEEEVAEAATAQASVETMDENTEDPEADMAKASVLPAYEYPGPELFYSVLYQYIIDECGQHFEKADVGIPCLNIVAEDESDKNDIKVWGDFWYYNYELNGDTLEMVSGGSFPGCIHIKSTDEGYEVTEFEMVGDGADYTPTAKKIFGKHYDEFTKMNEDTEAKEKTRAQIIANYVAANNLEITQYKDYGWEPVKLPEENIDSFYSTLD
ncbi:hypothetical protein [Butyrivibrio sp. AD3002]|uniref:hypothetical protein n=1 Tax=Butyrivibrio sp. AD3002 TaxID=1280670 RepID=UPI0003B72F7C|nr:hypothetical protein [Butyrivibrio sp. AD3002]